MFKTKGMKKEKKFLSNILICLLLQFSFGHVQAQTILDKVVKAIAQVESNNNEKIVSKNKAHVGLLQISKITVDECNRILGYKKFSYEDRYNGDKSLEMFYIIVTKINEIQ